MTKNKFFWTSAVALIFSNAAALFNYLNQAFLARTLQPADFGTFNAVLSLSTVFFAYLVVLPFITTKIVIEHSHETGVQRSLLRHLLLFFIVLTCTLSSPFYLFTHQIATYLNIPDTTPILIYITSLIFGVLLIFFTGVAQGLHLYTQISFKETFVALSKISFLLLFFAMGRLNYNFALMAEFAATLGVGIWMYLLVSKRLSLWEPVGLSTNWGHLKRYFIYAVPIGLHSIVMSISTTIDMTLVKHFCSAHDAGIYAAAAAIGRVAYFISGILVTLLFPKVLQESKDGHSSMKTLLTVVGITALAGMSFSAAVWLFPSLLLKLLFGAAYSAGGEIAKILVLSMTLYAILNAIFVFLLAKNFLFFIVPTLLQLIVSVGLVYWRFHANLLEIATTMLGGAAGLFILMLGYIAYRFKSEFKEIVKS